MTAPNDPPNPPSGSSLETCLWQPGEIESGQTLDDTNSKQPQPAPEASVGHLGRIGRYRIVGVLGKGAFGTVYRGYDDELKRPIAIKVPHRHLVDSPEDIDLYLEEAQVVASLDHANIVPVHDVGQTEDGLCYVVSKFIEGSDLARRIGEKQLSHYESAGLVMAIAEALHHAHLHMVVHRDVKPANILIDAAGKPYLADFGLALKEEDFGGRSGQVGTPAYMSPEQARGEGHLVDGRADIFSLGVVFYELLTATRPFWGANREEIIERIRSLELRPPRQVDDSIPKELERICLKAVSKRASERYSTAIDMAEDLRAFLAVDHGTERQAAYAASSNVITRSATAAETAPPSTPVRVDADKPVTIVPKGLRSFDAEDAEFFLELLPGPHDRQGLPESLRFWKRRIETTDPDQTFRVGLIYGPSGCGKSSLVKAGLLPRLADHVTAVYVEAEADGTEARLLRALRRSCPRLPGDVRLVESIAALRRGRGVPAGKKVLIVLDQFEQWLYARIPGEDQELVQALRQCDAPTVQCVVMVRDDFWLAISRFFQELEVPLLDRQNSALVDLFDPRHARKVLTAFGRAYGALPARPERLTREQETYLDDAVAALAREGKVVCVRLALFAEMMKGREWTQASLRSVGGAEGIGATFLEETFSASTAPPEHRLHEKAARLVLGTLLPDLGTEIKRSMRSAEELLEASGYARHPQRFADLLRLLDGELRLITPTDPEGLEPDMKQVGNVPMPVGWISKLPSVVVQATGQQSPELTIGPPPLQARHYQLTHDYLVHSLRNWLTRKQKETRRGRTELLLAERSSLWNARPENRRLPSLWESFRIRMLTRRKSWSEPQLRMMRAEARRHFILAGVVALAAVVCGRACYEAFGRLRAEFLTEKLLAAETADVPDIVHEFAAYRRWSDRGLRQLAADSPSGSKQRLHAALALLPVDRGQVDYLSDQLLAIGPDAFPTVRDQLADYRAGIAPNLWDVLENASAPAERRLRAACALAAYEWGQGKPDYERWRRASPFVADRLVASVVADPSHFAVLKDALAPAKEALLDPLAAIFRDAARGGSAHVAATNLLADYAADRADLLAALLADADPKQFALRFEALGRLGGEAQLAVQHEFELDWEAATGLRAPDPSWGQPPRESVREIESADGVFTGRWAFCQTMPLETFVPTAESLRAAGYRPAWFQPYVANKIARIAAVWGRDRRAWRFVPAASDADVLRLDEELRAQGLVPMCLSELPQGTAGQERGAKYLAAWVGPSDEQGGSPDADTTIGFGPAPAPMAMVWTMRFYDGSSARRGLLTQPPADWDAVVRSKILYEQKASSLEFDWGQGPPDPAVPAEFFAVVATADLEMDAGKYYLDTVSDDGIRVFVDDKKVLDKWRRSQPQADRAVFSVDGGKHLLRVEHFQASGNACLHVGVRPERLVLVRHGYEKPEPDGAPYANADYATVPSLPWTNVKAFRELLLPLGYCPQAMLLASGVEGNQPAISILCGAPTLPAAADSAARRAATAAVALLRLGHAEQVWPLLQHSPDPSARSQLIHRLGPLGTDPRVILRRLDEEKDVSVRRALLLCLGEFGPEHLSAANRDALVPRLLAIYRDDPDPGIHGASEWLLRQWRQQGRILPIDQQLAAGKGEGGSMAPALAGPRSATGDRGNLAGPRPTKHWYINGQSHTMVILPGPVEFMMGSPKDEWDRGTDETLHRQRIKHSFAIASKDVAVAQFERFKPDDIADQMILSPEPDCPIRVTWYEAAAYCNWLSKQEGIADDQWCYVPNDSGEFAEGMKLAAGWSTRTGYRLPTEAEWEYACRAGAVTSRYYGRTEKLLGKYAWYSATTEEKRTFPAASLKPNDFGLFDVLGNESAWCQDRYEVHAEGMVEPGKNRAIGETVMDNVARVLRGGAFFDAAGNVRCAHRGSTPPPNRHPWTGFRVARTCN
ncbi:MAG: protein kinase domain-containing protein [Thermoguttaceae bacterium]